MPHRRPGGRVGRKTTVENTGTPQRLGTAAGEACARRARHSQPREILGVLIDLGDDLVRLGPCRAGEEQGGDGREKLDFHESLPFRAGFDPLRPEVFVRAVILQKHS